MDHHIISTNLEITSSKFVRVWERITSSALVSESKLRKESKGIKTKAPHTTLRKTQEREREHPIHKGHSSAQTKDPPTLHIMDAKERHHGERRWV
jgi:hypothetical protein